MKNTNFDGTFISSWSGGKDSSLAFYYAKQIGLIPRHLLNMITENPLSKLKEEFVKAQALSINIPIYITNTTWNNYEKDYVRSLNSIIKNIDVDFCVFGDMDIDSHKKWNQNICTSCGLKSLTPLWKQNRENLLNNFLSLGFKATINVVNTEYLDKSFLGKEINQSLIKSMKEIGIDICGENGEYHTIVTDGPIFSHPIKIKQKGIIKKNRYCYLDFSL